MGSADIVVLPVSANSVLVAYQILVETSCSLVRRAEILPEGNPTSVELHNLVLRQLYSLHNEGGHDYMVTAMEGQTACTSVGIAHHGVHFKVLPTIKGKVWKVLRYGMCVN